jgi:hypothetical protein
MKRIRASRAVNLIKENRGRFFGIVYKNENNEIKTYNVRTYCNPIQNELGNIKVKTNKGGYKQFNPRQIINLNIAGSQFKIRK